MCTAPARACRTTEAADKGSVGAFVLAIGIKVLLPVLGLVSSKL